MDDSILIWAVMFGAVGLGFLTYGRQQKAIVPLLVGVALMLIPYFIPNLYLLLGSGLVLMGIAYYFRY